MGLHNPGQGNQAALDPAQGFHVRENLRKQGRIVVLRSFVTKAGFHRDTLQMLGKLDDLSAILVEQGFESLILESRAVVQDINIALWEGSAPEGLSIRCRSWVMLATIWLKREIGRPPRFSIRTRSQALLLHHLERLQWLSKMAIQPQKAHINRVPLQDLKSAVVAANREMFSLWPIWK